MTGRTRQWAVFDYGGVISRPTAALPSIAAALGVPAQEFEEVYFDERISYDLGRGDLDYWQAIGSRLGVEVDEATCEELTKADINGWLEAVPETVQLVDDLYTAGVPLALLSNAPSSFARVAERQPWAMRFEHLIFSGDLRIAKPDPRMWAFLLDRLGVGAEACLFFDDLPANVDGARRAGMRAELWQGANTARKVLREQGFPVGDPRG